jgi:cyclopropane-fatty-acyl-phospholipid synthase
LEARREEAIRVAGETAYRVWRLYMSSSAYHFDRGDFNVYQTLLAKPEADGTSRVPWSRGDLYA